MGEFDIIREVLAPLSQGADGAFKLEDDAALLAESEYVATKDLMVEGVHFLKQDPLDLVARKLLRVNLSDLAAKGAQPVGYLLGCVWPLKATRADIELFAKGLAEDQKLFRMRLYGGDTTRHVAASGPLTLSATFFGKPARQGMVRRAGAAAGDDLYVTGSIGDGGLGLEALRKPKKFEALDTEYLISRYRLPEPRIAFGGALAGLASAAIDISDGLVADAGHIAEICRVKAEIDASAIPLSPPAREWVESQPDWNSAMAKIACFGDDYEILFAAPPSRRRAIEMAGKLTKTTVSKIGVLSKGESVVLRADDGEAIDTPDKGFDHFRAV